MQIASVRGFFAIEPVPSLSDNLSVKNARKSDGTNGRRERERRSNHLMFYYKLKEKNSCIRIHASKQVGK
jgi:hypothetical protein